MRWECTDGTNRSDPRRVRAGRLLPAAAVAATVLMLAGPAQAQSGGSGFLFKEPIGSFSLRGGFSHATAGSDIFSFAARQLTLAKGDFSGLTVGADLAFRLTPRLDLVFGSDYAGTSKRSEFRDFVDQDNLPIEQTTSLMRVPATIGLKAYLT